MQVLEGHAAARVGALWLGSESGARGRAAGARCCTHARGLSRLAKMVGWEAPAAVVMTGGSDEAGAGRLPFGEGGLCGAKPNPGPRNSMSAAPAAAAARVDIMAIVASLIFGG